MSDTNANGLRALSGPDHPDRRAVLRAVAGAGLALALGGCASANRRTSSLPSPLWPDDPLARVNTTAAPPPTRSAPTPEPRLASPTGIPNVIGRNAWTNAQPIPSRMNRQSPIRRVTIHHDGMPPVNLNSQRDVADRLAQIRHLHVDNQGWGDIGYHYIVDPQGRVWEGRPISWQGAHVANQNPGNIGVMCLGNFEVQAPTRAQIDALDGFVGSLSRRYSVSVSRISTHQELAPTLCPGRNLQRHMDSTRASGGRIASLAIA